jgi:membrane protein
MIAAAALAGLLALGSAGQDRRRVVRSRPPAPQQAAEAPRGVPQDDAGRDAAGPSEIPRRGWWMILKRTAKQASEDRLMTEAAGVTFYVLLALFPAIAALVSLYGLVADPAAVEQHVARLAGVVPGGGMELIEEQVRRLASQPSGALGIGAIAGILISLWSANQATKAIFDALNVVYEEEEKRGFVKFTLVTLAFTLGGLVFAILAMLAVVVLPVVLGFVGLASEAEWALRVGRWPILALLVGIVLAVIYRYGPSRTRARWQWVSWGSAFAAVAWLIASLGFSWYVANFGSYNETYGSLGAVVGFMTWVWISTIVVLLGAELNAEMEHQTAQDTTRAPEKPMGRRGARMADTVAS